MLYIWSQKYSLYCAREDSKVRTAQNCGTYDENMEVGVQKLNVNGLKYMLKNSECLVMLIALLSEKAMAPHSSTLAWKIPWMEEPGRLQSMGLQRVGHNGETSLSLFTFMHWRRQWQPTPVFLPGESQGQQSLVGCCLWGLYIKNVKC